MKWRRCREGVVAMAAATTVRADAGGGEVGTEVFEG